MFLSLTAEQYIRDMVEFEFAGDLRATLIAALNCCASSDALGPVNACWRQTIKAEIAKRVTERQRRNDDAAKAQAKHQGIVNRHIEEACKRRTSPYPMPAKEVTVTVSGIPKAGKTIVLSQILGALTDAGATVNVSGVDETPAGFACKPTLTEYNETHQPIKVKLVEKKENKAAIKSYISRGSEPEIGRGTLAICSRGELGIITRPKTSYFLHDEFGGFKSVEGWVGIHLSGPKTGKDWSSRKPTVIGRLTEENAQKVISSLIQAVNAPVNQTTPKTPVWLGGRLVY